MSTSNHPRPRSKPGRTRPARDALLRFNVAPFEILVDLGCFDGRRVELLEGMIHEMTSKPPHAVATELVLDVLRVVLAAGWRIRPALAPTLNGRSRPEPDFAVIAGSPRDDLASHPTTAALVTEISDATLRKDRVIKSHLYARAGVADYWIVNLVDRQLEVHRIPGPDPERKGRFGYGEVTVVPSAGSMAPQAAPGSLIAVADLLP